MRKPLPEILMLILLIAVSIGANAQRSITGKINDAASGEALPGVTILQKGTQNGTTSTTDGTYVLKVADSGAVTLIYSLLGYAKKEVKTGKTDVVNVQLLLDVKKMNEAVIVAYGEATRKDLTASVTTVEAKKLEDIPLVSIDQVLQGQVAGLQVSTYSGQPGGEVSVRLRGVGSIAAGTEPLYVVDGVPINTGTLGSGITWTSNSLAGINANDIETVTVLKDASATAIYGSRGANGVIVITTKKGKAGKTKIRFDTDFGANKIILNKKMRPLNASEYRNLTYQSILNAGNDSSYADIKMEQLGCNRDADVNWLDEVTRTSLQNSYNLSASGGDEKTHFYISGAYFKQTGTTIGSDFIRGTGTVNISHQATPKLKFEENLSIGGTKQHTPFQSGYFRAPIISAYFLTPFQRPRTDDGAINLDEDEFPDLYNPLGIDSLDENYLKNLKVLGSLGVTYEVIKNLKLSTKISIDYNNTNEFIYANPFYGDGVGYDGWADQSNTDMKNWVWTNLADYRHDFEKQKLNLSAKLGYEAQKSQESMLYSEGQQFPLTTQIKVLSAAAEPTVAFSSISDYTFVSLFSDAHLTWQSKYTVSGSFRRDGSSRFGKNNRYGNFYSVGASWSIYMEDFMKNVEFISSLRLRTSYGQIGNADIGNYTWQPLYDYGNNYNGNGSAPSNPGNYDLTWEKNNPFNVGIDAGFLKDRISLIVDFYTRKTTDMLLDVPISKTSGFSTTLVNVGEMVNRGLEITVGGTPILTKDINWRLDLNFATNHNEITKLYNDQQIIELPFIYQVGQSYQAFYTRLYAGVDPQTGQALWYTDSTKTETTTKVANAQRSVVGSAQPKFFGGFTSAFSYKQFSLSFQINYVFGNKIFDGWAFYLQSDGAYYQYNQTALALDAWQNPGDVTDQPQYVYGNNSNSNFSSTRFLYDGDYIRLRDITFSYNFTPKMLQKIKLGELRLYIRGTNFYTWTKDKHLMFDPDVVGGISDLNLPNTKTVVGGISIGF